MHTDARKLDDNSLIQGDICIVGAGASGISMARELSKKTGRKVILLEGGGFQVEPEIQDLYKGRTTGLRYFPLQSARLHYFGGTTGHWAGFCSRYDPIDFKQRSWVPHSGWPITIEALTPYYKQAQEILELGTDNYDPEYWLKENTDLIPLPFDKEYTWNKIWQFSPPTRFGTRYREDILHSENIHLYTYANVTNIETDEQAGTVTGLEVRNLAGRVHRVKARYYILACCAIQNARLLLASNKVNSRGLGNDKDLVGRYFMEHLEVNSADFYLESPAALQFYMWEFFTVKMRAEIAITEKKQEEYKILNGTASLSPYMGKEPDAFINTFSDSAEVFVRNWEEREKKFKASEPSRPEFKKYRRFNLFTRMEQAPNPDSRVSIDTEKDALGVPRVVLNWQMTAMEKRSIRTLYDIIGRQAGSAGIGRVRVKDWLKDDNDDTWPDILGGGWHHMGTTRMHDDPNKGVVDANCRVHGIQNLYVAGSSCFTTGGTANPTLTLVALSMRLADHLKKLV